MSEEITLGTGTPDLIDKELILAAMPKIRETEEGTSGAGIELRYPEVALLRSCTTCECTAGHQWEPKLALAKCGFGTPQGWVGCGTPFMAVKAENCPRCNEPMVRMRLRVEFTPPVQRVIPICVPGSKTNAEVLEVVMERNQYKQVQSEAGTKLPVEEMNKEIINV